MDAETKTTGGVARVFDLAWQDTELAIAELDGLDNGQLQHVEALCRLLAGEAKKVRSARPRR